MEQQHYDVLETIHGITVPLKFCVGKCWIPRPVTRGELKVLAGQGGQLSVNAKFM